MAARRQPIEQFGPDHAPLATGMRRVSIDGARTSGDNEDHSRALAFRQHQPMLQPVPRRVERMAMQVDGEIGRDNALRQLAIPAGVEPVARCYRRVARRLNGRRA